MAQVERRDKEPEPQKEQQETGANITRRDFLVGTGSGIVGLVIGGVVGREVLAKPVPEVVAPEVPAEEEVAVEEEGPKAGYTLVFDPYHCTGCIGNQRCGQSGIFQDPPDALPICRCRQRLFILPARALG